MMNLHSIRENYSKKSLSKSECKDNPIEQFEIWLNDALTSKVNEPTAMHISTVENNKPSSRIVLLKEVNELGFVFFSNYHSRKGQQIQSNPNVALTFFWPELERQVRIEGTVNKLPAEESDRYFNSRPYTSQIGAWASEQSQILRNKKELIIKAAKFTAKYPITVPRPTHWGGYLITPTYFEFWQGRPSRLHDRICYQFQGNEWVKSRLSP